MRSRCSSAADMFCKPHSRKPWHTHMIKGRAGQISNISPTCVPSVHKIFRSGGVVIEKQYLAIHDTRVQAFATLLSSLSYQKYNRQAVDSGRSQIYLAGHCRGARQLSPNLQRSVITVTIPGGKLRKRRTLTSTFWSLITMIYHQGAGRCQ